MTDPNSRVHSCLRKLPLNRIEKKQTLGKSYSCQAGSSGSARAGDHYFPSRFSAFSARLFLISRSFREDFNSVRLAALLGWAMYACAALQAAALPKNWLILWAMKATMGHPRLALRPTPLPVKALLQARPRSRMAAPARCEVRSAKGKRLPFESITVKSPVGEGSFGQVFQVY